MKRQVAVDVWAAYKPLAVHLPMHKSDAFYRLMVGGVGTGKTIAAIAEGCRIVSERNGNRLLIGRRYATALKRTTMLEFWNMVAPIEKYWIKKHNKDEQIITVKTADGGEAMIFYLDLDDEEKIKSLQVSVAVVDEASELSEPMFDRLDERVRLPGSSRLGMLLCTNPTNVQHWLYKRFVKEPMPNSVVFRTKTSDNPYVTPEYEERLRSKYTKEQQRILIEGEWGDLSPGDAVYPMFDRDLHVKKFSVNWELPLYRGWDFGLNTTVCLFAQQSKSGRLVVLDAAYFEGKSLDYSIEKVKGITSQKFPMREVHDIGDISVRQGSALSDINGVELFRNHGIEIISRKQRIQEGVWLVQGKLERLIEGYPALMFDSSCEPRLFADFTGYVYGEALDRSSGDRMPDKKNGCDHACDALRYMATYVFGTEKTRDTSELVRAQLESEANFRRFA